LVSAFWKNALSADRNFLTGKFELVPRQFFKSSYKKSGITIKNTDWVWIPFFLFSQRMIGRNNSAINIEKNEGNKDKRKKF